MASRNTNEKRERMESDQHQGYRSPGAMKKWKQRHAKKVEREIQAFIEAEILFQPPIRPESYQHSAAEPQTPATATPSLGRQAADQLSQYEMTNKQVPNLVERMNGKLGEVEAAVAQLKEEHAKLIARIDHTELQEEPTLPASDIHAVLALSSVATPVLSTSVSPPPDANLDLSIGPDFLRWSDAVAARADKVDRQIPRKMNKQDFSAFADGFGEGPSDDMVLQGMSDRDDEVGTQSLEVEENVGEGFDFEQYISFDWTE